MVISSSTNHGCCCYTLGLWVVKYFSMTLRIKRVFLQIRLTLYRLVVSSEAYRVFSESHSMWSVYLDGYEIMTNVLIFSPGASLSRLRFRFLVIFSQNALKTYSIILYTSHTAGNHWEYINNTVKTTKIMYTVVQRNPWDGVFLSRIALLSLGADRQYSSYLHGGNLWHPGWIHSSKCSHFENVRLSVHSRR